MGRKVKLSPVTDDMVLNVKKKKKNPNEFTHKHINYKSYKFSKIAGYKINSQTPVVFLYTSNEQYKKTIKEQFRLQ